MAQNTLSAPFVEQLSDHDAAPLLSPSAVATTPASPPPPQNPPDYSAPSSASIRRVQFHSPPPSLRSEADNESLLPSYAIAAKYGKYGSEDKYLAALKAWAEQQTYIEPGDTALEGFYGKMTIQDYIDRPGGGWRSKSKKERRAEKLEGQKREGGESGQGERRRRKSSLSKLLSRNSGDSNVVGSQR